SSPADLFAEFVAALLLREYRTQRDSWRIGNERLVPTAVRKLLDTLGRYWRQLRAWSSHSGESDLAGLDEGERKRVVVTAGLFVLSLAHLAYAMSSAGLRGTTVPEEFVRSALDGHVSLGSWIVPVDVTDFLHLGRST